MAVHKGVGPYGAPITLDQAKKVMAAAEATAKQNNWNVVISIVDSGGHVVMLERLDGTTCFHSHRRWQGPHRSRVSPTDEGSGGCDSEGWCGITVFHGAWGQSDGRRRSNRD